LPCFETPSPQLDGLSESSFSLLPLFRFFHYQALPDPGPCDFSRAESKLPLISTQICYTSQSTKTRPHQPGARRRPHQIIPPAKTSTGFERDFSSAITGFRSLCGRKQRSLPKLSRSKGPAFWNL
jgi:hypothetical protein